MGLGKSSIAFCEGNNPQGSRNADHGFVQPVAEIGLFVQNSDVIDPKKVSEAKNMLNRAYTYFKLAADEVKDHGTFVFEGTDRYQSYISDYRHDIGKKSGKAQPEPSSQF